MARDVWSCYAVNHTLLPHHIISVHLGHMSGSLAARLLPAMFRARVATIPHLLKVPMHQLTPFSIPTTSRNIRGGGGALAPQSA